MNLSYGVYLYHVPIIWTMLVLGITDAPPLWIVVLVLVTAAASASWFFVEAPDLKLKGLAPVRHNVIAPTGRP